MHNGNEVSTADEVTQLSLHCVTISIALIAPWLAVGTSRYPQGPSLRTLY